MSLRFVIGVVVAWVGLAGHGAAAERTIIVDAAGVPFEPAELAAAIRVRVALAGPALHVRVTATTTGVHVATAAGARDVELGGRHGVDAARLVALAASDLLSDLASTEVATVDPVPIRRDSTAVGVLASAAGWDGVLGGLALELLVPRGDWLLAFDVGGGSLFGGAIQLTTAEVRAGVGRRTGPIELRVEAIAEPVFVTTGVGDLTALIGASASVRTRFSLGAAARAVIAAGGDAFVTQTEYRVAGQPALTTPRIAPWLTVGVEVPL